MKEQSTFLKTVCLLAIPVALQSMLQSSFSIVDQIMIGQLGSISVAGVGLAGKFSSIYTVLVSAVAAVAGIMIAQYMGQKNKPEIRRSFYLNLWLALGIAVVFTIFCLLFSENIMGIYSKDRNTVAAASRYLRIIAGTFLPMAGATLLAAMFRCIEKAQYPLYASIASAILNTALNYVLIFGKCGFSPMGADGAAIATVISQYANFFLMLLMILPFKEHFSRSFGHEQLPRFQWGQYLSMILPILACELAWSLGENVYAAIYGHIGTQASAAMTLTNPVQGLLIGALCGLSQAAAVIIGKRLGSEKYDDAYEASKKLILYGFVGSIILSLTVLLTKSYYVEIYQVEDSVKLLTSRILTAYALVAPFKVLNMILGGGIIRSGGKTNYLLIIDLIGTWGFGVPLGLLSAFVFRLSIPYVYFILSLEEAIRFFIGMIVFQRKHWMNSLKAEAF